MADKKTYYYLKLKEGFFDSEDMLLLQGMKDGYIYSDILLKLYEICEKPVQEIIKRFYEHEAGTSLM